MKKKINLLDQSTIIKIAAGEIIENPASIVKELVENSIDAGSSKIIINIEDRGSKLIKVTDNGSGIDREDLSIAFKRHTTSKINSIDDLNNSLTLGFRGEALSSISNVSDVHILTKTVEEKIGTEASIDHDGNVIELNDIVTNDGTTIIVKNLFDNMPVRKKYMESKNYEVHKTTDIITKLILSHPDISFEFIKDNKTIIKTDSQNSFKNNIFATLGNDIADNLERAEFDGDDFKINLFLSNNKLYKSNRNYQFVFVNNRSVTSSEIASAIEKEYSSIIPINRYPVFLLYLDIDSSKIDVNIHPKKDIIKFLNTDEITFEIRKLVKESLDDTNRIISIKKDIDENVVEKNIFDLYDFKESSAKIPAEEKIEEKDNFIKITDNRTKNPELGVYEAQKDYNVYEKTHDKSENKKIFPDGYRYVGQLFKQYLILEDLSNNEVYIVDQHAAHERINYERLKYEYENGKISVQHLIDGYMIELTSLEYEKIISIREVLKNLGIEFDEFGDNTIVLRTLPVYLINTNPEKLIRDILDSEEKINTLYDINPYSVMKAACGASIKAGDRISNLEVNQLITQLIKCEMPLTCPHGRPTMLKFSKRELDKEFFRIQDA